MAYWGALNKLIIQIIYQGFIIFTILGYLITGVCKTPVDQPDDSSGVRCHPNLFKPKSVGCMNLRNTTMEILRIIKHKKKYVSLVPPIGSYKKRRNTSDIS